MVWYERREKMIYINGRFLGQKVTGVQRFEIEFLKQLDEMEEYNKNVTVLIPKDCENKIKLKHIQVQKIGLFKNNLWEQISLPLFLRKQKHAKLLNMGNTSPILYPGHIVIHDISFKTYPDHINTSFKVWYGFMYFMNLKRQEKIFTISNFSKREIMEEYRIDEEEIRIIYNAADHMKNIKPDYQILTSLNLEGKPFCFSLGSKSKHKNHKYIEDLAKKYSDITFVVTGANNHVLKDTTNDDEILNNLIYTGYLSDEEICALYKKCTCFILPSLYEGFGLPPLEAMFCGCKNVAVSDIEVFHELYGDSVQYLNLDVEKCDFKKIMFSKKKYNRELLKKYTRYNVVKDIMEEMSK